MFSIFICFNLTCGVHYYSSDSFLESISINRGMFQWKSVIGFNGNRTVSTLSDYSKIVFDGGHVLASESIQKVGECTCDTEAKGPFPIYGY